MVIIDHPNPDRTGVMSLRGKACVLVTLEIYHLEGKLRYKSGLIIHVTQSSWFKLAVITSLRDGNWVSWLYEYIRPGRQEED